MSSSRWLIMLTVIWLFLSPLPQKKSLTPPLSASRHGSLTHTPPLISGYDDDCVSDRSGKLANSPTTPSTSFAPPKQEFSYTYSSLDIMFNDYIRRSHPDCAQPPASVQSVGRWRDWSWSQLKPPRFPVGDDDNYDDDMDEDPPDSFEIPSDIFLRASLSFVSQLWCYHTQSGLLFCSIILKLLSSCSLLRVRYRSLYYRYHHTFTTMYLDAIQLRFILPLYMLVITRGSTCGPRMAALVIARWRVLNTAQ